MELADFLRQTQAEIQELLNERMDMPDEPYPFPESVFTEVMIQHMYDIGMTFEPVVCHFEAKVSKANVRLSGYALSDEVDQLDMFVSLYSGSGELQSLPLSEATKAADYCLRFLSMCAEKKLSGKMDESSKAYEFATTIEAAYPSLDQVRVYVLTDRVLKAKSKQFQSREIQDKTIKLEVMDIERLYRHTSAGKPRDELAVNFEEVAGEALPCVWVPGQMAEYDYAMTVIPGEALRFIYEKYGQRILEANVRSFLQVTGKVNKGIRDTLKENPEHFMAYNNGLVIVADEAYIGKTSDGGPGITWLKGMQIVNGGQTTASLYFTKKKDKGVDLSSVRVPAKLIVLRSSDSDSEDSLIRNISKYANSQNKVNDSDLEAHHELHKQLEHYANTTYCPDGVSRWFYERSAGSYRTLLIREGSTPAKKKALQKAIPTSRKVTKPDMAKFLNIWDQKPAVVSQGAQKNFLKFMVALPEFRWESDEETPTLADYKRVIAKGILFKAATKLIRPKFQAFQANITAYTLALVSLKLGDRMNLDMIWNNQDISNHLKEQISIWAVEVQKYLYRSSSGKMISEWAKNPKCWDYIRAVQYSDPIEGIPECN